MAFKILRDVADPDLVRVQQNIAAAFQEATSSAESVATASVPQFRCADAVELVFVNQASGAVTVVLPALPHHPIVTVRSISKSTNGISIMTVGRGPTGQGAPIDGAQLLSIKPLETVRLAFDGSHWWSV